MLHFDGSLAKEVADPLTKSNLHKFNFDNGYGLPNSIDSDVISAATSTTSTEIMSNPCQPPPVSNIDDIQLRLDRFALEYDHSSLSDVRLSLLFHQRIGVLNEQLLSERTLSTTYRANTLSHMEQVSQPLYSVDCPSSGEPLSEENVAASQHQYSAQDTEKIDVESESHVSTIVMDPSIEYLRNRLSRNGFRIHDFCYDPPKLPNTKRPLPNPCTRNPFEMMGEYEFRLSIDGNMSLDDWYLSLGSEEVGQPGFLPPSFVKAVRASAGNSRSGLTSNMGTSASASTSAAPAAAVVKKRQKTLANLDSVKCCERELPIPGEITRTLLNIGWVSLPELCARLVEKDWLALERYDRAVGNFQKEHPHIRDRADHYRDIFSDIRLDDGRPWISRPHYDNPDEWFKGAKRALIAKMEQEQKQEKIAQENRLNFGKPPKTLFNGLPRQAGDTLESLGNADDNDVDGSEGSSQKSEADDELDDNLTEEECLTGMLADGGASSVDVDGESGDEWAPFAPHYSDRSRHYVPGYLDRQTMYRTYQTQMGILHYNQRIMIAQDYRKFSRRQWFLRQQDFDWAACYRAGNPVAIAEVNMRREEAAKAEASKTLEMKIQEKWDRILKLTDEVNLWDEGIIRMKREGFWEPHGYANKLLRQHQESGERPGALTKDSSSSWPVRAEIRKKRVAEDDLEVNVPSKKTDTGKGKERETTPPAQDSLVTPRFCGLGLKRYGLRQSETLDSIS